MRRESNPMDGSAERWSSVTAEVWRRRRPEGFEWLVRRSPGILTNMAARSQTAHAGTAGRGRLRDLLHPDRVRYDRGTGGSPAAASGARARRIPMNVQFMLGKRVAYRGRVGHRREPRRADRDRRQEHHDQVPGRRGGRGPVVPVALGEGPRRRSERLAPAQSSTLDSRRRSRPVETGPPHSEPAPHPLRRRAGHRGARRRRLLLPHETDHAMREPGHHDDPVRRRRPPDFDPAGAASEVLHVSSPTAIL